MARIAMNLSGLTAADLAAKLQVSLTAIAADTTTFTGAAALLTLGNTKHNALTDADAAVASLVAQLSMARASRDQAFDDVAQYYTNDLAGYVTTIAKGDEEIILAAGMDVQQPRGPSPAMTKVGGVVLSAGGDDGTALVEWDAMFRSRMYEVQLTTNPNDAILSPWSHYCVPP